MSRGSEEGVVVDRHPATVASPRSPRGRYKPGWAHFLSLTHTTMIFTTVLISCLVALLGVLQHASFDILSSMAHLRHPSISSFNAAFLQLTGYVLCPSLPRPRQLTLPGPAWTCA